MPQAFTNKGIGPTLLTNIAATMYTVPAATSFVLQSLLIANTSGSDATVTISIGADAAGTRIFAAANVPANTTMSWEGRIPISAGTIIQSYGGTDAVLTFTAGGFEVS